MKKQPLRLNCARFRADYARLRRMTRYQRSNALAQAVRRNSYRRQAALVFAHARRHPRQLPPSSRGRRASRKWWVYSPYWRAGFDDDDHPARPTERAAVKSIREQAEQREPNPPRERVDLVIRVLWAQGRRALDKPNGEVK